MKKLLYLPVIAVLLSFKGVNYKVGKASWYGGKFHGRRAADGSIYNKWKLTCAATKEYDLGEKLLVRNPKNGKEVIVKVTDRGAFKKYGRTLDLSRAAFSKLANINKGVITVHIVRLKDK